MIEALSGMFVMASMYRSKGSWFVTTLSIKDLKENLYISLMDLLSLFLNVINTEQHESHISETWYKWKHRNYSKNKQKINRQMKCLGMYTFLMAFTQHLFSREFLAQLSQERLYWLILPHLHLSQKSLRSHYNNYYYYNKHF